MNGGISFIDNQFFKIELNDNVLSCITTIIVCCVTHFRVRYFCSAFGKCLYRNEKAFIRRFFEPQRHEGTKKHEGITLCSSVFYCASVVQKNPNQEQRKN